MPISSSVAPCETPSQMTAVLAAFHSIMAASSYFKGKRTTRSGAELPVSSCVARLLVLALALALPYAGKASSDTFIPPLQVPLVKTAELC